MTNINDDGPASAAPSGTPDKVRELDRDSLFMQGVLQAEGLQPITIRVRNLSAGGMMADFSGNLPKGAPLTVELRNLGQISGRVAWVADAQIGISFDTMIDPQAVRRPIGVKRDDLFRPPTLDRFKRSF